jgi:hypothetical protein
MAVKGWFDITPEERKSAFLHLRHRDISEMGFTRTCLTSLLSRFGLLGDPQIHQHFREEKIRLPHPVSKEARR